MDDTIVAFNGPVPIGGNGDGQSVNCSAAAVLGDHGTFACADMKWEVTYTLPEQANNPPITKAFRFYLNPRTKEWVKVGLEAPPQHCPGE
jgi:hypothetical protein